MLQCEVQGGIMFKDLLSTIETIFSMDNEYFVLVLRTILLIVVLKLVS